MLTCAARFHLSVGLTIALSLFACVGAAPIANTFSFQCRTSADCLDGSRCVNSVCVTAGFDAGDDVDAGGDIDGGAAIDAGPFDAGVFEGDVVYSFDFRQGLVSEAPSNPATRLVRWNDVGSNHLDLIPFFSNADYACFRGADGAVVLDLSTDKARGFKFEDLANPASNQLNGLHDGTAFLIFVVLRIVDGTGSAELFVASTGPAPGLRFLIQHDRSVRLTVYDQASVQRINAVTSGTVPTGEYVLVTATYGGQGAGADNLKLTIREKTYPFSVSGPLSAGRFGSNVMLRTNAVVAGTARFDVKASGAFRLAGLTPQDIDTFVRGFMTRLKSDPEYAALVTP